MNLDELLIPSETNSLYPTAMSPMETNYQKTETSFVFTKDFNNGIVNRYKIEVVGKKETEKLTAKSGILKN